MPFAIKYRRVDRRNHMSTEILATDIESREEASRFVDSLANSFSANGRYQPETRWFRNREGTYVIWAQPQ